MLIKAILAITGLTLASGKFHFMSLPSQTLIYLQLIYEILINVWQGRK
jgi:hypothetical protein